jgi:hypothetical protein
VAIGDLGSPLPLGRFIGPAAEPGDALDGVCAPLRRLLVLEEGGGELIRLDRVLRWKALLLFFVKVYFFLLHWPFTPGVLPRRNGVVHLPRTECAQVVVLSGRRLPLL